MRASAFLTDNERASVEQAVAWAEQRTSAEFVVAVAAASGDYRLPDVGVSLVGAALLITLGEGGALLFTADHAHLGGRGLVELLLAGALGGWLAARLWPALRLPLVSQIRRQIEAQRAARRVFEAHQLGQTAGRSGLLIYVSLFEQEVVVRADQAVAAALGPDNLRVLHDLAAQRLHQRRRVDALCDTIEAAAEKLAPLLPPLRPNPDELSNRLLVYDRRP